jgi:DNA-binding winged helix-turn-helix (wHTH) protein
MALEFLGFHFDSATGKLRQGTTPVPLEFQPSKVLARLLESPGMLVSRDELAAALWGHTTHVNFDDGLNYCIRQVRAALGDDPRAPRFIETMPRRGYRFIAPVAEPRRRLGSRLTAVLAAAASLALVTVAESRPNNHHEIAVSVARAVHDLIF